MTSLELGAEVYGLVPFGRNGAAAELIAIGADLLARRPRQSSWVEAAALSLAGPAAWQALHDHGSVVTGERVLVLGGSGGIGSVVVQLAVWLGADVSATASASDLQLVRSMGASDVFDRATDRIADALPFDVVIDATGGVARAGLHQLDRRSGRLVRFNAPTNHAPGHAGGFASTFVVEPSRDQLVRIAILVDEGAIRPLVAATYPLAEGRAAYVGRTGGRPPGKTVLLVR